MSFFSASTQLEQLVSDNGWAEIPDEFVTREGKLAKLIEGRWYLPCETSLALVDLNKYGSPILQWVVAKYMVYIAKVNSSIHSFESMKSIHNELNYRDFFKKCAVCTDPDLLRPALVAQMEIMVSTLKEKKKLWRAYRPIRWYLWAAENYPELGFCESYAAELDVMKIPGGPKGEAVRSQDPEEGPLHPHLEISLITHALRNDTGEAFEHYQQRAAVALAQAYGRNCANYIAMREEDIYDLVEDAENPEWVVKLPRIKKGFISARSDFIVEAMEDETRHHLQALIQQNQAFDGRIEVNEKSIACARPLFRRMEPNHLRVQTGDYESAFHIYTAHFGKLLRDFAKRMKLVSPITRQAMILSARRFRYTVGTVYAASGVPRAELARRLDHSDLQHVQVYYDILDVLTYDLDKAAALEYSRYVNLFCGTGVIPANTVIATDDEIVSDIHSQPGDVTSFGGCGLDERCHLFPPYSCYLCPKFRPYVSDVHEQLLDTLLRMHNERPDPQTLGVHRMDVILAVAQVVKMCQASAA
jgi:integrase